MLISLYVTYIPHKEGYTIIPTLLAGRTAPVDHLLMDTFTETSKIIFSPPILLHLWCPVRATLATVQAEA